MPPKKKPHLSPSQLDMYTRCPEQYRRRYIERHVIPPGIALLKGTAVHIGAEHNFRQKVESRKDLPAKEIVDIAASAFDANVKASGVFLTEDDQAKGKDRALGDGKDGAVRLAGLLAGEVAPKIQPVAVETDQRITLSNASHDLLGRLDLIDDSMAIRDLKTGAKARSQQEWDNSAQMTFYALLYQAHYGLAPSAIKVDQLVDLASGPKYVPVQTKRDETDFRPLINRINAVLSGIKAGVFTPATPGAWWCSPRMCGYWATCKFVNSERKAAAAKTEE